MCEKPAYLFLQQRETHGHRHRLAREDILCIRLSSRPLTSISINYLMIQAAASSQSLNFRCLWIRCYLGEKIARSYGCRSRNRLRTMRLTLCSTPLSNADVSFSHGGYHHCATDSRHTIRAAQRSGEARVRSSILFQVFHSHLTTTIYIPKPFPSPKTK